jgi:transcriptional regulator with XRE-family HTH domain
MARTAQSEPPAYGRHLSQLRRAAGLTQQQVADMVGVKQSNIAFWERAAKPPRGEVLPALAKSLGVSVEEVLGVKAGKAAKHRGPSGRLEGLLVKAASLPRRRQERIASVLEAMLDRELAETLG